MALILASGCGGRDLDTSTPTALAFSIFRDGRKSDSDFGATEVLFEKGVGVIEYKTWSAVSEKELNALKFDLADDIEDLFGKADFFDKVRINLNMRFADVYGRARWGRAISVRFTRETVEKINWTNFDFRNLNQVAESWEPSPTFLSILLRE